MKSNSPTTAWRIGALVLASSLALAACGKNDNQAAQQAPAPTVGVVVAEPPTDTLRGLAIDWVSGKPARQALIELVLLPDSLVYRAVADSGGRFALGPLPKGAWRAFGAIDQKVVKYEKA